MKKISGLMEVVFLQLIALVCFVLDIGDIFNLFNFLPANYIPMLTLLLAALVLSSQTLFHQHMNKLGRELQASIQKHEQTYLNRTHLYISDDLRKVLGDDFFTSLLDPLQIALNEHTAYIHEEDEFHRHYCSTLENYPTEAFISSVTSKTYSLWQDTVISEANAHFIKNGGKIQQIFFIKNKKELSTPEIQSFFAFQKSIGIDMSIVPLSPAISYAYIFALGRKSFLVASKSNIVWEVSLDDEGMLEQSALIMDSTKVSHYRYILKRAYKYRKNISSFTLSVDQKNV